MTSRRTVLQPVVWSLDEVVEENKSSSGGESGRLNTVGE
jgi:hypothetical protein